MDAAHGRRRWLSAASARRRPASRRGFNMLEVAIALVLLSGLSGAAYGTAVAARTEFDHARHRTTLQTLVSTMSRDAAARSSLFNPQLLPRYVEGERFEVTGIKSFELSPISVSTEPGSVAAVLSEDLQLLSVAMASTSGRCLRTYSVAGIVAPVSSQRSATCRPLLPDSIREGEPGEAAPSAPVLSLVGTGNGSATFSWTRVERAVAYVVTVRPGGASCVQPQPVDECVITLPAGEFQAVVEAQNSGGFSLPSNIVSFAVATAPDAPTLTGAGGPGQVTVSWDAPEDNGSAIVSYWLRYRSFGGVWQEAPSIAPSARSFTLAGLAPGEVELALQAANAWGASPLSNSVFPTATALEPPTLTALSGTAGGLTIGFTLPGGQTVTGVEYTTDPGSGLWRALAPLDPPLAGTGAQTIAAAITETSAGTSLQSGVSYEVALRVVLTGDAGTAVSAPSNILSAALTALPGAPTITTITASDQTLSVAFTPPANDGGAAITTYEYSLGGGAWQSRGAASTASPLVIGPLINGVTYSVRIRAVNAVGAGAPSLSVTATPFTTPSAPVLTASPSSKNVNLSWTAPTNNGRPITGYVVQYKETSAATWILVNGNVSGTSWPVSGLAPHVSYDFRVAATNLAGTGAWSTVRTATPWTDTLLANDSLTPAGVYRELKSVNGIFTAVMQGDGNFVVYDSRAADYWSTQTQCSVSCNSWKLELNADGLLRVVNHTGGVVKTVNPHAGQAGGANSKLVMQDDGNLTIYRAPGSNPAFSWSLYTSEGIVPRPIP